VSARAGRNPALKEAVLDESQAHSGVVKEGLVDVADAVITHCIFQFLDRAFRRP
jgi:hypothetical protein